MSRYIRKNAYVEATQINTLDEARALSKKLGANRFGVEDFSAWDEPDQVETKITIIRTKQHHQDLAIDLRFNLGYWVVEGVDNELQPQVSAYSDRTFKKYFDATEEPKPAPEKKSDTIFYDGVKSRVFEDWFGEDFVGWANENVPGQVRDKVLLQIMNKGSVWTVSKPNLFIKRMGPGEYIFGETIQEVMLRD